MTHRVRRIILFLTTIFFIFFAPTILFYAWGYSFDWESKKPVLTGGLYLRSIPKEAKIYLNNKNEKETPSFVKRLLPKNYQVQIEKDGFHSWQKNLKIESGLVTEVKNILLVPVQPEIEEIEEEFPIVFSLENYLFPEKQTETFYIQEPSQILYQIDSINAIEQISLTPLPKGDYQIFVSNNKRVAVLSKTKELYLLNLETRAFELISRNIQNLQFSDDNKKLLYSSPNEIWVYYLKDISEQPNKKAGEKELATRLSQKIDNVIWYGRTNEHIIFSVNQKIKIIELDSRDERNTVDLMEMDFEQISYNPKDEKIYFFTQGKLSRTSLEE